MRALINLCRSPQTPGCQCPRTESGPLQMLVRPYLLPIYPKRDNPTRILTIGGNRLLA